jgi:hypothetical protein
MASPCAQAIVRREGGQWIDVRAPHEHFEVQVRAGRLARGTDQSDCGPGPHALADANVDP